jgi:hypothetical protein
MRTTHSLHTRKQISAPVAGNLRLDPPGQRACEVDQLAVQDGINRRSIPGADHLQRPHDVFRQPDGHGTKGQQRRQDGHGVVSECVIYLGRSGRGQTFVLVRQAQGSQRLVAPISAKRHGR